MAEFSNVTEKEIYDASEKVKELLKDYTPNVQEMILNYRLGVLMHNGIVGELEKMGKGM